MTENWQVGGFGLYLHWPFCEAKCPYCDFNSHVVRSIDHVQWTEAYLREIDRIGQETGDRVLRSVYFGGGTPSLMRPETVGAILDKVAATWTLANDVEITLEANPGSVEAGRFAGYRSAGVNRVSLGVQALNDGDLRRLGRLHDVDMALKAIAVAQRTFDRTSFDLIYARQDQSPQDWRDELRRALDLAGEHLSLYQLTIEDGTAFGDRFRAGKLRGLPEEDRAADMYEITQELCEAARLPAYEVSNHARAENASRHNLIYWQFGDYAGVGPGAHGRLSFGDQRWATETLRMPGDWLQAAEGSGVETRAQLNSQDMVHEYLMMGMRINAALDLARLENLAGQRPAMAKLRELEDIGVLSVSPQSILVTPKGRPILNAVIAEVAAAFD